MPEIRKRCTAEMALFQTGDCAANGDAEPIWRIDGRGKLAGITRTMSGEDLLRRIATAPIPVDLTKMAILRQPLQRPRASVLRKTRRCLR